MDAIHNSDPKPSTGGHFLNFWAPYGRFELEKCGLSKSAVLEHSQVRTCGCMKIRQFLPCFYCIFGVKIFFPGGPAYFFFFPMEAKHNSDPIPSTGGHFLNFWAPYGRFELEKCGMSKSAVFAHPQVRRTCGCMKIRQFLSWFYCIFGAKIFFRVLRHNFFFFPMEAKHKSDPKPSTGSHFLNFWAP